MAYADDDQSLLEAEEDESLPDRDQANLSAGGDAAWKEREAAVLAIGAVAEGCVTGLHSHLSEIVAFLIPLLKDKFPLIRSISCWTLSRFSKYYIVQDSRHQTQALMGLLRHRRILGTNKSS